MKTILQIKQDINDNIRTKVLPSSITKENDANNRDDVVNELRDRGVLRSDDTAGLALISTANTRLVLIKNLGVFAALETEDPADDVTTFASADAGWLWEKFLTVGDGSFRDVVIMDSDESYLLEDGFMIDKILIKPTIENTVKVGLSEDGDEIMFEDVLPAAQNKSISRDIIADGVDVEIFFTGFTADARIIFYKRLIS
jgi:hypothetical protein